MCDTWWIPIAMDEEGTERYKKDLEKQEWYNDLSDEEKDDILQNFFDEMDGLSY